MCIRCTAGVVRRGYCRVPIVYIAVSTIIAGNIPKNEICRTIFTTLLLGRYRSGTPFWDIFLISVALSLGAVLRLSNISRRKGREAKVVGTQSRNEITKKNFKNHNIDGIITSKEFLSVKICK